MSDDFENLAADVESAFEEVRDERLIMSLREQMFQERGVAYFKCPDCGEVSPSVNDIENRYCPRCHEFKA